MRAFNLIIFLLCMSCISLAPNTFDVPSDELIQCCNEYIQYLGELQKASQDFEQKYNDEPRLQCTKCKDKKLSYGEIVGWVIGHSAQALAAVDKFNMAKKVLIETIEGLSQKTPDELSDFMLRTANDLQVVCSHCQAKHWEVITSIVKSNHQ